MFMQDQTAFAQAATIDLEMLLNPNVLARSGLLAGTKVEAAGGWRPVESLLRGDAVFTLDGGLRQVQAIRRDTLRATRVISVPGGALGNCAEMALLPGQLVMIEDDHAERAFGTASVLVPAAALAGYRGIRWHLSTEPTETITLIFDEDEVVWGNTGALLHCPDRSGTKGSKFFNALRLEQARALVALMQAKESESASAIRAA